MSAGLVFGIEYLGLLMPFVLGGSQQWAPHIGARVNPYRFDAVLANDELTWIGGRAATEVRSRPKRMIVMNIMMIHKALPSDVPGHSQL